MLILSSAFGVFLFIPVLPRTEDDEHIASLLAQEGERVRTVTFIKMILAETDWLPI
jgi:hypothetical protein